MNESFVKANENSNSAKRMVTISGNYFDEWRRLRLISTILASSAIIPTIIDYELSYSNERTPNVCKINASSTIWLRILTCVLSYLGIVVHYIYRKRYYKWINHYPWTFEELPPPNVITSLEILQLLRKRKFLDYLKDDNTWVLILLYMIFPYPGIHTELHITQQIGYKDKEMCYYVEEIFQFVMFLRLFYLVEAILGYGRYQTPLARWTCVKNRISLTPSFAIKCYARTHPISILIFIFFLPGIFIFGTGIRLFERPLRIPGQDFEYMGNAMWCIIITMTTIITSNFSRIVICLSIFWGGIILSLMFVTLGGFLRLRSSEFSAFRAIRASREAGELISESVKRRRPSKYANFWFLLYNKVTSIRLEKTMMTEENTKYRLSMFLTNKIQSIENNAGNIEKKLEKLYKSL